MPAQRIEGGKATLQLLPDGTLYLQWALGCLITTEDALSVVRAINDLVAENHPMLVDMGSPRTITHGAREIFAIPDAASPIALVGSSPVDQVIANFFLRFNAPPVPMKFFTSHDRAWAWLKNQAEEKEYPPAA
jgi:hypothetical protein